MKHKHIQLGFTDQQFEPGVHICQIFSDDEERQDALYKFLLSGMKGKEKVACFSEKVNNNDVDHLCKENNLDYEELCKDEAIKLASTEEVYFQDNKFIPERMIDMLTEFYNDSEEQNFTAARVIGEMTPTIQNIDGGDRLMEYESKVSLLLKTHPVTAVCQYDANNFDGSTIMDILKVHPYMIIKGTVVHNPFFIKPEDFLT